MHETRRFTIPSATVRGAEAVLVQVEVIVSSGLPGFSIVGMPDAAIQESRERVRAALRSSGFSIPGEKIVFNLAPSSLKKAGSGFDFPMAAALLAATGQIPHEPLQGKLLVGELSLDGQIRSVNGLVAFQTCAFEHGLDLLCAPTYDALGTDETYTVHTISYVRQLGKGEFGCAQKLNQNQDALTIDYADVGGHRSAKRAMQIAAAGNHGILMMGPPGSGKTMLAKRLSTILPPLTDKERSESAQIASIVGEPITSLLQGIRPFRSPHHSATLAGLVGGGNPVRPGEVTLAHNGVLMLDELSEFSHSVLQGLRQPIEDGRVSITRADGNVVMPARFMLVAASNPCPCGYFGDNKVACTCPLPKVHSYQGKIGGPLIDRFDMCIDVWRTSFDEVVAGGSSLDSATLRAGVMAARAFAFERLRQQDGVLQEPRSVSALIKACRLSQETKHYFRSVAQSNILSGRGIMRTLRVARTIADLDQSVEVKQEHLAEAINLRIRAGIGSSSNRASA